MKPTKYIIIKKSVTGDIYTVNIDDDRQLSEHISACFSLTDEEIISVTRVVS